MKIYIPNISNTSIGGGFTFCYNLKKGLEGKVEFVTNWKESDIVFVFGITTIDKGEIKEAIGAGKKFVLRIDNIPRKSRNKRQSPAERLTEFGNQADVVVYQSEWAKGYAGYFIDNDNEVIINNGVDTSIFNTDYGGGEVSDENYLYINYNDNPNKRFDEALYWFDIEWRKNHSAKLFIAGNVPRVYREHPEYNWDIPSKANVEYVGIKETPEQVAELMKKCKYILYPSFAEAYPNTLLEAIACGLYPIYINEVGGSKELLLNNLEKIKSIQDMSNEYLELFEKLL